MRLQSERSSVRMRRLRHEHPNIHSAWAGDSARETTANHPGICGVSSNGVTFRFDLNWIPLKRWGKNWTLVLMAAIHPRRRLICYTRQWRDVTFSTRLYEMRTSRSVASSAPNLSPSSRLVSLSFWIEPRHGPYCMNVWRCFFVYVTRHRALDACRTRSAHIRGGICFCNVNSYK